MLINLFNNAADAWEGRERPEISIIEYKVGNDAMASQGLASQNPGLPDEYEKDANIVTIDEARKIIAGRESGEDLRAVGLKHNLFYIKLYYASRVNNIKDVVVKFKEGGEII